MLQTSHHDLEQSNFTHAKNKSFIQEDIINNMKDPYQKRHLTVTTHPEHSKSLWTSLVTGNMSLSVYIASIIGSLTHGYLYGLKRCNMSIRGRLQKKKFKGKA